MGMTIDEAISHLGTYSSTMGSGQTTQEQHEESKRVAIETMRKYQKIEQIYREWFSDTGRTSADAYARIGEVIKDGKID